MTTFIIATRNAHKTVEIRQILGDRFSFRTLNDFPGAPAVVEDAATFEGNAKKKAQSLAWWLPASQFKGDCYILADDSGLEVDLLGGAPGVYSARFAAASGETSNSPDSANNAKLLRLLDGASPERRTARFRCVLALCAPPGTEPVFFEGICDGRIASEASGSGGFGYDPLFVPEGYDHSFAELGEEVKNKISHRSRALEKLRQFLA
ncbi:MAG TPA: RdgB/HAM1 family non-canonical purine NTP pyrophosphatase [Verrucomicrobiae bacterium]